MGKKLPKKETTKFIKKLLTKGRVYAPIKTDLVRFQEITTEEEINKIDFEGHAFFPPKKYLLPNKEEILIIKNGETKTKNKQIEKQIIINARLCDLNAINILDQLYLNTEPTDPYYKAKREATTLIGLNCQKEIDEYCFCGSMDLQRTYDLLLHDMGEYYYVDIRSEKGEELVKELEDYEEIFDPPMPKTSKVLEPKNLWNFYADKWWEEDVKECFGCERCTILCPTCFCFSIEDETELKDLKEGKIEGKRYRVIDSCHSTSFTRVAGGHEFRPNRLQRYRHRVMHKIQYFKDRYKRSMCTGCGRCIRYCHSKIDFVKTINKKFETK